MKLVEVEAEAINECYCEELNPELRVSFSLFPLSFRSRASSS
jgi:hypothetical protein